MEISFFKKINKLDKPYKKKYQENENRNHCIRNKGGNNNINLSNIRKKHKILGRIFTSIN